MLKHLAILEGKGVADLRKVREPLFRELEALRRDSDYNPAQEPHRSCLRELNQMRISPLEARAIFLAFRTVPYLRAKLAGVLERVRREVANLEDSSERQNFDCPLLDGTRCLVHHAAKPVGCTAWNPGREYSKTGMRAFRECDKLNDRVYGSHWKSRVIPLWLQRVFRVRAVPRARYKTGRPRRGIPPSG